MALPFVNVIQAMLAPGLMVSACGLFLLGVNNKYSLVVNRIRLLSEEKRKLKFLNDANSAKRLANLYHQLTLLDKRVRLIRNAVFSFSVAVAFFMISSLFIGLAFVVPPEDIKFFIISFFLLGMFCVFFGALFGAIELWFGYRIISLEMDEENHIQ